MRSIFGVLSLLVVMAVIGVLVNRQMGSLPGTRPVQSTSAVPPGVTPAQQSQSLQQQTKNAVEAAVQQVRPMSNDHK